MGGHVSCRRVAGSPPSVAALPDRSAALALVCAASLALAAAFAPAAAQADVTDSPAGTLGSLGPAMPELIDRPGDRDWYAAPSTSNDEFAIAYFVRFTVTAVDPSCPAADPLLVGLHNPEAHWMRTYRVRPGTDGTSIPIPASDGRYLLAVSAADPGCSGLQYLVVSVGAVAASHFKKGANGCRIAKGEAKVAAKRVKRKLAQIKATRSAAAKRRHERDLRNLKRFSDAKTADARKRCA